MKESEKRLEANLRDRLRALGGLALKLPAIHHAGLPDRLCLLPDGVAFFVEVKSTGEKPRPLQGRRRASTMGCPPGPAAHIPLSLPLSLSLFFAWDELATNLA